VFLFVDISGIEKEEEEQRKQAMEQATIREEEELKRKAENPTPEPAKSAEEEPAEDKGQAAEDNFTITETKKNTGPELKPDNDVIAGAIDSLANSFFQGQGKWPEAIGVGVSFESDSFDVRALMISQAAEKPDVIPFFRNFILSAPVTPGASAVLPADTELFAMLALDLPQIYAAMSKPPIPSEDRGEMRTVNETEPVGPFDEFEKRLKIKIKEELLPLLGSEVVISLPLKILDDGPLPKPAPRVSPTDPKTAAGPSFVVALSLKDREGMRALLPKIIDSLGFKGASSMAQIEKREDTEIVSYGNAFSYAFIENFLVISADLAATRHVVDSYLKHETLASDAQFRNYTRWQPRQLQAQVYVSPALMESYKSWIDQPSTLMSDQTREILSRLSVLAQPVTYSLTNDGLGTLHELHVPKNLLLMAVTGISAETNPPQEIANERYIMGVMYMIGNAETQYHTGKGAGSFGSLEQLQAEGLLPTEMIKDNNNGYRIELTLLGDKFEATAVPIEYGKTGKRSYFIDHSQVLRGADHGGGMATLSDSPIQ